MALFSIDGKFMKFMDRLVDVFLLNLLWLLCCLPVVTIGASTVAAFSVTLRMVDDEEGSIFRDFLQALRTHWKRATVLWLFHAAALYALWLDWQILSATDDPPLPLLVVGIVSGIFVFGAFVYAYALLARYSPSVRSSLQNSLSISFRYGGRTALLVLVLVVEVAIFAWNTVMFLFGILVGPMIMIYTISGVAKRIFQRLDQSSDQGPKRR